MHACVLAALNAANGRANVAIEIYKNGKPKADVVAPGNALPAGFVAPPRTIADITAILDSEKPDPATLAKLKAAADDEPKKGMSQAELSDFYNDRALARSQLGRNAEALADGERALSAAKAAGDFYFTQRIQILIASQKRALGDIKGTLQNNRIMVSEADRPAAKAICSGRCSRPRKSWSRWGTSRRPRDIFAAMSRCSPRPAPAGCPGGERATKPKDATGKASWRCTVP